MDYKWSARDGWFQYPSGYPTSSPPYPDASTEPVMPMSGSNIIYEQTYFIPAVGLAAKLSSRKDFSGTVSFTVSPFVFCNDVDNHTFARVDFYDTMMNGLLLEPKIALNWQVLDRARLSIDVSYRHIAGLLGNTSDVKTGLPATPGLVDASSQNTAGASYDAMNVSVGFNWTP